ncbi:MAG: GNAT family N-acetyltransferase [Azoarcus sp.]|nr:GNAT family N-acetyltransferase [Azoarcus sp.]
MTIRYLEEKDIDDCLALMAHVKDDFAGYEKNEFIQAMRVAIAAKDAFVIYGVDTIAGLIAFSYKNHEITFLTVNPDFRKKGIAKSLIREVMKCFRLGEMLHVITFRNDDPKGKAAIACYYSCGFKDGALLEVYGYPCQKMILRLPA